jgi:hypothetical protein
MTITFATPLLLFAMLALPILWLLLRAVPPAPIKRYFPGVILLLGLTDKIQTSDRTPWWLSLLRMLALGLIITGLAGPVLNPQNMPDKRGDLLILLDGGWASARDWKAHQTLLDQVLRQAENDARPVAILQLAIPQAPNFQNSKIWLGRLKSFQPQPWSPSATGMVEVLKTLGDQQFDSLWLSDGVAQPGRASLLSALNQRGEVKVIETRQPLFALEPAKLADGLITLHALRLETGHEHAITLRVHSTDPGGQPQILTRVKATFDRDQKRIPVHIRLPTELRERVSHFDIEGQVGAAAVALTGNSLLRHEVALISDMQDHEGLELLSPLHFIKKAFSPTADVLTGQLTTLLSANPELVVLANIAKLSKAEDRNLTQWVNQGGLLLRFAGPKLAASDLSRDSVHPLMPVRLRAGGRTVGGAMSWGAPKSLAAFPPSSPFFGLEIPPDVRVSAQVLAQPDPLLSQRVIAALSDGTPLVTRKRLGSGQIVLFHVTANAEWSSLPLSGLFVQMLDRLSQSVATATSDAQALQGTIWKPEQTLTALGQLEPASRLPGVAGEELFSAPLSKELRPGLYSHVKESAARNVLSPDSELLPAEWPLGTNLHGLTEQSETPLGGWCLLLAIVALLIDVIATLGLTGQLASSTVVIGLMTLPSGTRTAEAQQQDDAVSQQAFLASSELTLAYIQTGDAQVDAVSKAGLEGLSQTLFARTSVEPATPAGLDLERDALVFYPLIYWPMTPNQTVPSQQAYHKLNAFMRSGGMILFDSRDGDITGYGAASPNGRQLQKITFGLDIPLLEAIPPDHVLTRTFYLMQDFPGRYTAPKIWVEAAPQAAQKVDGMPFRNLNDGVSPVVIGGNDWAAAWAQDAQGNPMFQVGRTSQDSHQRELAYRFGINLVMHVLTGNYKSDQVHVPALLDRLGQ